MANNHSQLRNIAGALIFISWFLMGAGALGIIYVFIDDRVTGFAIGTGIGTIIFGLLLLAGGKFIDLAIGVAQDISKIANKD